jgi:hypothetical protein
MKEDKTATAVVHPWSGEGSIVGLILSVQVEKAVEYLELGRQTRNARTPSAAADGGAGNHNQPNGFCTTMVSSRSGPTETIWIGTPTSSSMRFR